MSSSKQSIHSCPEEVQPMLPPDVTAQFLNQYPSNFEEFKQLYRMPNNYTGSGDLEVTCQMAKSTTVVGESPCDLLDDPKLTQEEIDAAHSIDIWKHAQLIFWNVQFAPFVSPYNGEDEIVLLSKLKTTALPIELIEQLTKMYARDWDYPEPLISPATAVAKDYIYLVKAPANLYVPIVLGTMLAAYEMSEPQAFQCLWDRLVGRAITPMNGWSCPATTRIGLLETWKDELRIYARWSLAVAFDDVDLEDLKPGGHKRFAVRSYMIGLAARAQNGEQNNVAEMVTHLATILTSVERNLEQRGLLSDERCEQGLTLTAIFDRLWIETRKKDLVGAIRLFYELLWRFDGQDEKKRNLIDGAMVAAYRWIVVTPLRPRQQAGVVLFAFKAALRYTPDLYINDFVRYLAYGMTNLIGGEFEVDLAWELIKPRDLIVVAGAARSLVDTNQGLEQFVNELLPEPVGRPQTKIELKQYLVKDLRRRFGNTAPARAFALDNARDAEGSSDYYELMKEWMMMILKKYYDLDQMEVFLTTVGDYVTTVVDFSDPRSAIVGMWATIYTIIQVLYPELVQSFDPKTFWLSSSLQRDLGLTMLEFASMCQLIEMAITEVDQNSVLPGGVSQDGVVNEEAQSYLGPNRDLLRCEDCKLAVPPLPEHMIEQMMAEEKNERATRRSSNQGAIKESIMHIMEKRKSHANGADAALPNTAVSVVPSADKVVPEDGSNIQSPQIGTAEGQEGDDQLPLRSAMRKSETNYPQRANQRSVIISSRQ